SLPDHDQPIITTKSELANILTAIETAYLLQDSIVLLYAARRERAFLTGSNGKASDNRAIRGLNFRHLGWHHALLGSAFVLLQVYIAQRKEKGILIIVAMLLMNASSPFGTLRWFLINFRPQKTRIIRVLSVAYMVTFAIFRVYLLYSIISTFGKQTNVSTWEVFRKLRLPCKLGMSCLALVNTGWLLKVACSFMLR
ncbi:uncharacterized protein A1O9_12459, partial [Exophiala aquamarina CBS 119918]